ncbi:hypothetical protein IAT38_007543 [Cryptococcus sp. DSM 104549]
MPPVTSVPAVPSKGIVIVINGYPGVGKFTVAKELAKLLPNAKVLDQHLMEDAARSLFDKDKQPEGYFAVRKALRETVLLNLFNAASAPPPHAPPIFILTETLPSTPTGTAALQSYLISARTTPFTFIHLLLACSTSENIHRLSSTAREAKSKLTDEASLLEVRMVEEIGRFYAAIPKRIPGLQGEYEIDTSKATPGEAALALGHYAVNRLKAAGWVLQLRGAK